MTPRAWSAIPVNVGFRVAPDFAICRDNIIPKADILMTDNAEAEAKALLDEAMRDVRQRRRAAGQLLHGWKREAAVLAVMRALLQATVQRDRP